MKTISKCFFLAIVCIVNACTQPHQSKEWQTNTEWEAFSIESDNFVENDSCKGFAYLNYARGLHQIALSIPIDTTKMKIKKTVEDDPYFRCFDCSLVVNGNNYKAYSTISTLKNSYSLDIHPSYWFVYETFGEINVPDGTAINVEVKKDNQCIYTFNFYPIPLTSTP